jgi:hypothetical protein
MRNLLLLEQEAVGLKLCLLILGGNLTPIRPVYTNVNSVQEFLLACRSRLPHWLSQRGCAKS